MGLCVKGVVKVGENRIEKTKEQRISAEKAKFKKIFKDVSKERKTIVDALVDKAAFMSISLEDLQQAVNEKGYVEEYQNGANQFGVKKCTELELYNQMIKNYVVVVKQMYDLLPCEEATKKEQVGEKLAQFIAKGKPVRRDFS